MVELLHECNQWLKEIYSNVHTKLKVIVWRNMRLFAWRDNIYIVAGSIWFETKYFYKEDSNLLLLLGSGLGQEILICPSRFCFLLTENLWRNLAKVIPYLSMSDSTFQEICFYLLQWKPFKNDGKCFKALFVLEIFTFLSWLFGYFGYVKNRLDKIAMVNFKIYDIADWAANNFNTHIAHYFQK